MKEVLPGVNAGLDYPRRYADCDCVCRNVSEHDGIGTDDCTVSNRQRAEDLRARTDVDVAPDACNAGLPCIAAYGHTLINLSALPDLCVVVDHDAESSVAQADTGANLSPMRHPAREQGA